MNNDEKVAIFTSLARIEEGVNAIATELKTEIKPDVKTNTKFRWFTTAFIVLFVGFTGFIVKVSKVKAKITTDNITVRLTK